MKIKKDTAMLLSMYSKTIEEVYEHVSELEQLIEKNKSLVDKYLVNTKDIFKGIEYKRRSVGGIKPFLKQLIEKAWVDPQRGNFAFVIVLYKNMQEALTVYKAGSLNKEPEYTKIFLKRRKMMPYFGMTLGTVL
jgi:hypothetical protein